MADHNLLLFVSLYVIVIVSYLYSYHALKPVPICIIQCFKFPTPKRQYICQVPNERQITRSATRPSFAQYTNPRRYNLGILIESCTGKPHLMHGLTGKKSRQFLMPLSYILTYSFPLSLPLSVSVSRSVSDFFYVPLLIALTQTLIAFSLGVCKWKILKPID